MDDLAPGANPQARAEGRSAQVSSRVWACFVRRILHDEPAAAIARDRKLAPDAVYVNSCRVMKLVRKVCEEFEEDVSHAFESDLS